MSSIKPEERPKVIALSTAVAVVFGVGGLNIAKSIGLWGAPPSTPASAAPSAVPVAAVPIAPSTPPRVAPSSPVLVTELGGRAPATAVPQPEQKPEVLPPYLNSDPFRPITPLITNAEPDPAAPRQQQPAPPIITPVLPPPGMQGTFSANQSDGVAPQGSFTPLRPAAVVEPPLELVGVVAGPDAVAMIRAGSGERFLRRGEVVLGYRVVRIGEDTVILGRGKQGRILRVGVAGSETVALPLSPITPPLPASRERGLAGSSQRGLRRSPITPLQPVVPLESGMMLEEERVASTSASADGPIRIVAVPPVTLRQMPLSSSPRTITLPIAKPVLTDIPATNPELQKPPVTEPFPILAAPEPQRLPEPLPAPLEIPAIAPPVTPVVSPEKKDKEG